MRLSRIKLHADRAPEAQNPMEKRFNWRLGALASAVALLVGLASVEAHALGLGRISVQSALGEPLRAEIEIVEINADEASSLRASVASAETFRASGLEYSPSVSDLQISVQKRGNGRSYLRLSSARAVTEPFVDLVLEANWSSGRVVRDYTMLFDPPNLRQAAAAVTAVTAPVLPSSAISVAPPAPAVTQPAPVTKAPPTKVISTAPKAATVSGQQIAVKQGDTAGKIAAQVKPASVSLDQMLAALLRSNPEAFINGNINRLKSGTVLEIPSADEAGDISPADALTTIAAQSRDFNDFRRKLAESALPTQVGSVTRQAGGKVQAKIEDNAPVAAIPDKLTLSKGDLKSKTAAEDRVSKDRQTKEASTRVAELAKNIGELNKLAATPVAAGPSTATGSTVKGPGIAVVNPGLVSAATPPAAGLAPSLAGASAVKPATNTSVVAVAPVTPVSASTAAAAPVTPASTVVAATAQPASSTTSTLAAVVPASAATAEASAPVPAASAAVTVKKPVAVVPAPAPEPGMMDELTDNPFVLPGLAGLVLLLGGYGFYRYRRRNNPTQVDSSFLESRLQPDSFFGASGGQRVDTNNEGGTTGSSLVYSPSQLDAAGDVDPVAEADVYLAYGRDLQAEEILKEALRTTPGRVAIHAKLLEIYAKRRDIKAFEVLAMGAFKLSQGEGPEWAYIGEMGRELDPTNALYQLGGPPIDISSKDSGYMPFGAASLNTDTAPRTAPLKSAPASALVDFDLDLDFAIGDEPAAVAPLKPGQPSQPSQPPESSAASKYVLSSPFNDLDMDLDTGPVTLKPMLSSPFETPVLDPSTQEKKAAEAPTASGLTFTNDLLTPPKSNAMPAAAVMDHGMLEFDMGSLSLDLDASVSNSNSAMPGLETATEEPEGPLETKFALAEEFRALGDMDGARALAEEVLAQAKGSLKTKAQAFVNALL